jgi:hypothetical protein
MWRTRRDLVRGLASLIVVTISLGTCFAVVIFSWPDNGQGQVAPSVSHAPVAIARTGIQGADSIPADHQTGSIHLEKRPSVMNASLR